LENDSTGAGVEQLDREQDDVLASIIAAAMRVHVKPKLKSGREFVSMHWLNSIAQGANLPANRKTQPLVLDACKRVGLTKLRVRGATIDAASLGVPCQKGSNITVGMEQFHLGHVPSNVRVYIEGGMFEDFDEEDEE
jgi:hypothetical protein